MAAASRSSVSVVITTYNHGELLIDAIRSVLAQTVPAAEIIVVDDGSHHDRSQDFARIFGQAVQYIYQHNVGIAGSRNRGVTQASGDLIALMDGDDLWHTRKLELQLMAYSRHPDSGIIAVRTHVFDPAEERPDLNSSLDGEVEVTSGFRVSDLLDSNFLWTTSAVAIPRRVFEGVGPSDPKLRLASDFDLYCRIAMRYPITLVEAKLTHWRYHASSASGPIEQRQMRFGPEVIQIIRNNRDGAPADLKGVFTQALKRKVLETAWLAYWRGTSLSDRGPSLKILLELLKVTPTEPKLWVYLVLVGSPVPHAVWRRYRDASWQTTTG